MLLDELPPAACAATLGIYIEL